MRDLSDDTLQALADAVACLGSPGSGVPHRALIDLGGLPLGGAVTVDFRAARSLGHPLVVLRPTEPLPVWWDGLTERERQVAELVADGLSNRGIAGRLRVTEGTVKDHVHAVLGKARFRRRSQIAASLARR